MLFNDAFFLPDINSRHSREKQATNRSRNFEGFMWW